MVYCPLLKMEIDPVDCMEIEGRINPPIFDKLNVRFSDEERTNTCCEHWNNDYKDPHTAP